MTDKKKPKINNLVAKHANKFNKSSIEEDKTKYKRKNKKELVYHLLRDGKHFLFVNFIRYHLLLILIFE